MPGLPRRVRWLPVERCTQDADHQREAEHLIRADHWASMPLISITVYALAPPDLKRAASAKVHP